MGSMFGIERITSLPVWNEEFLNNTVGDYVVALLVLVGLLVVFKIFRDLVILRLEKFAKHTKTDIDNTIIGAIEAIRSSFYIFVALYFAVRLLEANELLFKVLDVLLIILATVQVIRIVSVIVTHVFKKRLEEGDPGAKSMMNFMKVILRAVLWVTGLLLVLSNLGVNISSLVAGLGIGGIAVALALQNILGDLFSSFAIYLDKPFEVGDYVVIGEHRGNVEKIGIKTTRMRALTGEQIIISNRELTGARIQNFKRMDERRKTFTIGVVYETPQVKLKKIPGIIEKIVSDTKNARFDRVFFTEFGDSALIFEVTYFTQSPLYRDFIHVHHEILMAINEAFHEEGISMAYPTRTIYMQKS